MSENAITNVGVGWQPIITKVDTALKMIDPDYTVDQIKEKFGTLRYYITPSEALRDREDFDVLMWMMHAVASAAEHESSFICEDCGERGNEVTIGSWVRTLCRKHTALAWAKWTDRQKEEFWNARHSTITYESTSEDNA